MQNLKSRINNMERKREIRVFISSTFKDLRVERTYLMNQIFPLLRKECEKKNVIFQAVDLRWGIDTEELTDEAEVGSKVLKTCLQEIDRSTCFIGILGERYGWIPDRFPDDVLKQHDWPESPMNRSITELEIYHGVLKNTAMHENAFFYFRHPNLTKEFSPDSLKESQENQEKLDALKKTICENNLAPKHRYKSLKELGEAIEENITGILNKKFPSDKDITAIEHERAAHYFYAQKFAKHYIKVEKFWNELDAFLNTTSAHVLHIQGEQGSGKTALVANWLLHKLEHDSTDHHFFYHFVGATQNSGEWRDVIGRFIQDMAPATGMKHELPEAGTARTPLLLDHLKSFSRLHPDKQIIAIIDSINGFHQKTAQNDLFWLPPELPSNCKIILTSNNDIEKSYGLQVTELRLDLLDRNKLPKFITEYLKGIHGRELNAQQIQKIARHKEAIRPLFLVSLLEDLCRFGDYEKLNHRLEAYLKTKTSKNLFIKILSFLEEDFKHVSPHIVRFIFSYLYTARHGLLEHELYELLCKRLVRQLDPVDWSPIHLAMDYLLIDNAGLINIANSRFAEAVASHYLNSENRSAILDDLITYFQQDETTSRSLAELPRLLNERKQHQQLWELLKKQTVFTALWEQNSFELKEHIVHLQVDFQKSAPDMFADAYPQWEKQDEKFLEYLSLLYFDLSYYTKAAELQAYLVNTTTTDKDNHQRLMRYLANSAKRAGHFNTALDLYQQQERLCHELDAPDELQKSYNNQASIHIKTGNLFTAEELLEKQQSICEKLSDATGLMQCFGTLANVYKAKEDWKKALELHEKEERLCKQLGDYKSLHICYGNQAIAWRGLGNREKALHYHREEQKICEQIGDEYGMQVSLGNQGHLYFDEARWEKALQHYRQQESICRKIKNMAGLQNALFNIGVLFVHTNKLHEAKEIFNEQLIICKRFGYRNELEKTRQLLDMMN
ncbi:MAG: DUF4062 domain-containing protein [Calditrichaeota bacterium]|nr:MAG: DUF4062 domain-containing protein [Calditrichota bacterium]